ncbi:MAG: dipeptidase [Synergistaceae bacterium]|nr:dipeptidase [Synergistaceae bacterium]
MDERCLERAREFIANTFAMDAHFDLAVDIDERRETGATHVFSQRHDDLIRAGGWNCIVSSIFVNSWQLPEMGLRKALDQISSLMAEEREQPDKMAICTTMGEVDAANAKGRTGVILSMEGADPVGCDLRLLSVFYRLGVRSIGLAWSRRNYAADGCAFEPRREGLKGGLTNFGVELLEEAERLGMLIDVSHLNDEGLSDAAGFARRPFIASHSNCRAIAGSMRNLTDEQIRLVADSGGVIGMNGVSFLVSGEGGDPGPLELSEHIHHVINLVGDDFVGLGLDFCDRIADIYPSRPGIQAFDVMGDHSALPLLAAILFEKGYGEGRVAKIVGGNFRRVYGEIIG